MPGGEPMPHSVLVEPLLREPGCRSARCCGIAFAHLFLLLVGLNFAALLGRAGGGHQVAVLGSAVSQANAWLGLRKSPRLADLHHSGLAGALTAWHASHRSASSASALPKQLRQCHASTLLDKAAADMASMVDEPAALLIDDEPFVGPVVVEDTMIEDREAVAPKNVFGEMSAIARELGDSAVDLGQGFPDFDPPDLVVQALREELTAGEEGEVRVTHQYTRTAGYPPLVKALANRYSQHLGHAIDAMKELVITVGATGAIFLSLQTALEQAPPGCDEIVVLEPFFELYRAQTKALKGKLRTVPLRFDETTRSFSLDIKALSSAIGPATAAIIVNTPSNPTGKVFVKEELLAIADLVRAHPQIVVISDEVYKFMIFDPPGGQIPSHNATDPYYFKPVGHVHFARMPGMWSRTITVSSAGKTFGITGWQVGWAIGPKNLIEPMQRFAPNLQFCAPTLMQRALTKVLKRADEPFRSYGNYYAWLRQDYSTRRERMVSALEHAGIPTVQAQGGFFLLADISDKCGTDGPLGDVWDEVAQPDEAPDWTFCRALAKKLGIVALPVSPFFGPDTPNSVRARFVRFCFAKTDSTLDEATRRLLMLK